MRCYLCVQTSSRIQCLTIDWASLDQLFLMWFMNLNDGSLHDETADMLVLAFR